MEKFFQKNNSLLSKAQDAIKKYQEETESVLEFIGEDSATNPSAEIVRIFEMVVSFGTCLRITRNELNAAAAKKTAASSSIEFVSSESASTPTKKPSRPKTRIDISKDELESALEGLKKASREQEERKNRSELYLIC